MSIYKIENYVGMNVLQIGAGIPLAWKSVKKSNEKIVIRDLSQAVTKARSWKNHKMTAIFT